MGSKQEAVRARCLRVMSAGEFDEVCAFFRARKREGAAGLSKEELAAKFGTKNEQVVFQVEQYVYLSDLLSDVQAMPTAAAATTAAKSSGGAATAAKASGSSSSGGAVRPPSTPSKSSSTPTKPLPSGSASAVRKPLTAKPTSATSRIGTPTARAAAAAAGSKKK